MRSALALIPLIILAGCATDICPENLPLSEDTLVAPADYDTVYALNKVLQKSVSSGGEVYSLAIYSYPNSSYYAQWQPAHFSTTKIYGPFEGPWEKDLACE